MSQTDYSVPQAGVPGLRVPGRFGQSITCTNVNSSNPMPFGRMVAFNGTDDQCAALSGSSDKLGGIVVYEPDFDRTLKLAAISGDTNGTPGPAKGEAVTLARKGLMWVEVEATVAQGDRAYVRYAANGGNTMIGVFSNTSGTGLIDMTNQGVFIEGGASGGVALLEFDLTGTQAAPTASDNFLGAPSISVGTLSSGHIDVTVTVKRADGTTTVAAVHGVKWWVSDAAGGSPTGTAPSGGVSLTTGSEIDTYSPDVEGFAVTADTGIIVFRVTQSGSASYYLNVDIAGRVYSSSVLTFT